MSETTDKIVIAEICRELLVQYDDTAEAARALRAMAERNPALMEVLAGPALNRVCWENIHRAAKNDRSIILSEAVVTPQNSSAGVRAWAASTAISIMEHFRLPGGQKIGDATKADVLTAASVYEEMSNRSATAARFLGLVAKAMPDQGLVREVLTEATLCELRNASCSLQAAA